MSTPFIAFLQNSTASIALNFLPPEAIGKLKIASKETKQVVGEKEYPAIQNCNQRISQLAQTSLQLGKEIQVLEAAVNLSDKEIEELRYGRFASSPSSSIGAYYADQSIFKRIGYFFASQNINLPGTGSIQEHIKNVQKSIQFYEDNKHKLPDLKTIDDKKDQLKEVEKELTAKQNELQKLLKQTEKVFKESSIIN